EAFSPDCLLPIVRSCRLRILPYLGVVLGLLLFCMGRLQLLTMSIFWGSDDPFVQILFPGECPIYEDNKVPIPTAKILQKWFEEHEKEVGRLAWPPQFPDLNII
ncbi:unnamed protein product, partial [Larinioides sclopetarius]